MTDGEGQKRVSFTSGSEGEVDPDKGEDNDDVIYVDLTKDPESQNWLDTPAEKKKGFCEMSDEEKDDLKRQFQDKLEKLNR